MIPANVQVNINEKAVKEFIESKLQEQINQRLLLVDINKLAELTCMSVRYLEKEILSDPRIKVHERRKNRKRWWIAEPTFKAIEEIVSEW
ncbi:MULTISPECIES: hypothetical protein [Clostridia]|uniref:hypothetical protein n=1 Tax=Clostridia TaxID=186801 RepID=UPI000EA34DB8|nr:MULTISPECIES: hypothetical protein [Clostridia]NBJ71014.1 hypothetical protein [Roseburia sp. 1XD42-34]RKI75449.1 hypothetical protein D7V87_16360 [Clostridium sp. 1xD42-85]